VKNIPATKRAKHKSSRFTSFNPSAHAGGLKEAGATLEFRVGQGMRRLAADSLRRSCLETCRAHRNEKARRESSEALPPGVRLLDAPCSQFVALCGVCNFDEFRVYDFDTDLTRQRTRLR